MERIGIITDSTSDLTKELYEKNNIDVLPLYVILDGKTYRDGVDLTTEEMYAKIDEVGKLPKTSNVSPHDFEVGFSEYLKKYDKLIFIGISSTLSSTYNNAKLASEEFPEGTIYVVDSLNLSSGIGLLVLKAAKFRDQGMSAKEVFEEVNKLVPRVRTQFAINTLTYLHMGGRCSGTARVVGTLLMIHPIVKVVDGVMVIAKKPIGKFNRSLNVLLDCLRQDKDKVDTDYVMVTHSLALDDAKYLEREVASIVKVDSIVETLASGVISSHCGPRTIGILYIVKE